MLSKPIKKEKVQAKISSNLMKLKVISNYIKVYVEEIKS